MKLYAIEQSNNEVKKAYGLLIENINSHVKLLAENSKPITSYIGIKRGLLRLKIGYLEPQLEKEVVLNGEEELLAAEILETMNLDVKEVVDSGLIGVKEMKRQLVRFYYHKMAKEGKTYKEIKGVLSKRYGLSVSSIEKLVYRPLRQRKADTSPSGEEKPLSRKSGISHFGKLSAGTRGEKTSQLNSESDGAKG